MTRQLKASSILLAAVFATSAAFVISARADSVATEGGAAITLTGKQVVENELSFPTVGVTKCTTATFTGTVKSGATTVSGIVPTYSGCKTSGFGSTVAMNGCTYTLHVNPAAGNTTGTADLVCSGGKVVVTAISAGTTKCTIELGGQTGLASITGKNIGTGTTRELELTLNLAGITANSFAGTGAGACETTSTSAATLKGTATATGETDGGSTHVGFSLF